MTFPHLIIRIAIEVLYIIIIKVFFVKRDVAPRSATSFQCVCCDHFLMRMRLILQVNALFIEMNQNA